MIPAAYGADDLPSEHDRRLPKLQHLRRSDVAGPAVATARALLGHLLVRDDESGRRVVRIVETEAYAGPGDRASHARAGRTPRTSVMFGPPGHAYVYLVYGMHHCLNVVCGDDGQAAAVLIRAVEPVQGMATMRTRRGDHGSADGRLGAGPAKTCQALDIDRSFSGIDLLRDDRLWLAASPGVPVLRDEDILVGPRVGVEYAGPEHASRPWRFGLRGNPALSRPFPVIR